MSRGITVWLIVLLCLIHQISVMAAWHPATRKTELKSILPDSGRIVVADSSDCSAKKQPVLFQQGEDTSRKNPLEFIVAGALVLLLIVSFAFM